MRELIIDLFLYMIVGEKIILNALLLVYINRYHCSKKKHGCCDRLANIDTYTTYDYDLKNLNNIIFCFRLMRRRKKDDLP